MSTNIMDWQWIALAALGAVNFLFGIITKIVWDALKTLRIDMTKLSDSVNEDRKEASLMYVRNPHFIEAVHDIKATINRGFDQLSARLDNKADK